MKESDSLVSYIKDNMRYDADSGHVYWTKTGKGRKLGVAVGHLSAHGYLRTVLCVEGKVHRLAMHRVAWLLAKGRWPKCDIDHINRVRTDNRIRNLREASRQENSLNQGISASNKSGFKGVSWSRRESKWAAQIGSSYEFDDAVIGYFESRLDAAEAYDRAATRLSGEYAVTNRSLGLL